MIIIGIDPGTAITGFGVLEKNKEKNKKPKVIDYGCIMTKSTEKPGARLLTINKELDKLIKKYKPEILAVESLYFFKNLKTAMPVSQAKGVILLTAEKNKIPVVEFTPLEMKMIITGYGKAEKKQVQKMTEILLDLSGFDKKLCNRKKDDATDALCIALCCSIKKERGLI